MELWESLEEMAQNINDPRIVRGDFNVITNDREKLGGLSGTLSETEEFRHCIYVCNFEDMVFKRLICNDRMSELFLLVEVEHLTKTSSNHAQLHLSFKTIKKDFCKPFRFLNTWLNEKVLLEVISKSWSANLYGNNFLMFDHKPKRVKAIFSK